MKEIPCYYIRTENGWREVDEEQFSAMQSASPDNSLGWKIEWLPDSNPETPEDTPDRLMHNMEKEGESPENTQKRILAHLDKHWR